MAGGVRLSTGDRHAPVGWVGGCALLFAAALIAWLLPPAEPLSWRPARWADQPWRWWTAALVHFSGLHLSVNLAGLAALAVLGWAARLPNRAVVAWALAWPLTHLGLLATPALAWYGGLSGVLHAGAAVAALELLRVGRGARWGARWILGLALGTGLLVKLGLETPWTTPVRLDPAWPFPVAVIAHASGAAAGLLATLAVWCGAKLAQRAQVRMRCTRDVVE